MKKALTAELDDQLVGRFRTACQDSDLWKRVKPLAGLVRLDTLGYPVVVTTGSVFVTAGTDRRSTGTHYTPKTLTEPIVQYTLEPLIYDGPSDGKPKEEWKLRSARELLGMKVCDIACGSGAFLVEACRYLASRLQEAWQELEHQQPGQVRLTPEGLPSQGAVNEELIPADPDEREAYARRIVAQRCIYGVDKNPLAVEIAKLSLWLLTLAKDKPFEFLDHAIRHGDSLVGIHDLDQLRNLTLSGKREEGNLFLSSLDDAVTQAIGLRNKLENRHATSIEAINEQEAYFHESVALTKRLKLVADVLIGKAFDVGDSELISAAISFQQGNDDDLAATACTANKSRTPFHWPLEFPEVFITKGGFDACIGNPPFMGGQKITGFLGTLYREYLVHHLAQGKRGSANLCAYFFLRAAQLVRPGAGFGLIASNTIAQGDTREVAFDLLLAANFIVNRAHSSRPWPGFASLEISIVWVRRGGWNGLYVLDEKPAEGITAYLTTPNTVTGNPHRLKENEGKSFVGSYVLGMGFVLIPQSARALIEKDSRNEDVLFPYLNGEDLNSLPDQSPTRWVINFFDWPLNRQSAPSGYTGPVAEDYPDCLSIVKNLVQPEREKLRHNNVTGRDRADKWWRYGRSASALYSCIKDMQRVLIFAQTSKTKYPVFKKTGIVFDQKLVVIASQDDGVFSLLCSNFHYAWIHLYGCSLRTDAVYTPSDCFDNYPFPQTLGQSVGEIGNKYHDYRCQVMLARHEGLTKTYNRFHDPADASDDIQKLRDLHVEMDNIVAAAYGWSDLCLDHSFHETKQGIRYTISEAARREVLARLLRLNHERYADEVKKGLHEAKKKPKASKPKATTAKPQVEPTLLDLDTAFPATEREKVLCGLFCDLVAAEPGLRFDTYSDALMIAVLPERYEGLLPKEERQPFTSLLGALKLADKKAPPALPWNDIKATLLGNDSIQEEAGTAYVLGSRFNEVRPDYPTFDPRVVALIRKVAATLRDYQDLDQNAPAEGQKVVARHSEAKREQSGTTA